MPPETRRSPLAMVVLAHLAEEPMHVYRMQALIQQRAKDTVVNVAQRNSLYQTIARLERDGLVRAAAQRAAREDSRPERVVYELTDAGRPTLERWIDEMLSTPAREFPEFPAALAFLVVLPPRRVRDALEARRRALAQRLQSSRAGLEAALGAGLPRLFLLEDEYKQAVMHAELTWLDQVIAELASRQLTWSAAWLRKIARQMNPE